MTSRRAVPLVVLPALLGLHAAAQAPGLVRHTEAIEHRVQRTVDLPGTVESRTTSEVASEVSGLVVEMKVRPGDRVSRGQPLAQLRTEFIELQLEEASGQLKEAEARLAQAERNLDRARRLSDEAVISQTDLDDAHSERIAWQGKVDQTKARIAQLELALDRCTIRAPFDGAVVEKRTDVGQWMQQGGTVVEMVAPDDVEVRIDVPERYYHLLRMAVEVRVVFDALPGEEIVGRVDQIIPRADPRARSFPVKVSIANDEGRIGVGMLARVSLPVGETYRATVVPKDAVIRQGGREYLYRINGEQSVETVAVESGQGIGDWVVVKGAISPGDRVVTRGNERLQPGQAVQGEALDYPRP